MVDALLEQASWLTPTSLFLLLNFVIATILISSNRPKKPDHLSSATPLPPQPPQLVRAPSLFSRVTSFNFSNYYPDTTDVDNDNNNNNNNISHHRHYHSSPSFFSRVGSFNFSGRASEPDPDEPAAREENNVPDPIPADNAGQGQGQGHVRLARAGSFLSRVASFTYRGRGPQVEVGEMDAINNDNKSNININMSNNNNNNNDNGKKVEKVKKKKKMKKKAEDGIEPTTFKKKEEEVDAKADDFINKFKQQLKMQRIESLMRYRSA